MLSEGAALLTFPTLWLPLILLRMFHRISEIRPILYLEASDVAHRVSEPFDAAQGLYGIVKIRQTWIGGQLDTALLIDEIIIRQHMLDFVISIVVRLAVMLLQLGDNHVKGYCKHSSFSLTGSK